MKKFTALAVCIICATIMVVSASAAVIIPKIQAELRPDFTVKIDGEVCTFKNVNGDVVQPLLYEGTTYLPVRAIGEMMGKTVYWYEDSKTVELKDKKTTVTDADVIVPSGGQTANQGQGAGNNQQQGISLDKAKEIALNKAGLSAGEVRFTEAKKDFDNGRWVYDIEFVKNHIEYSAEILVADGTLLKWEVDRD